MQKGVGWDVGLDHTGPLLLEGNWCCDLAVIEIAVRKGILATSRDYKTGRCTESMRVRERTMDQIRCLIPLATSPSRSVPASACGF